MSVVGGGVGDDDMVSVGLGSGVGGWITFG